MALLSTSVARATEPARGEEQSRLRSRVEERRRVDGGNSWDEVCRRMGRSMVEFLRYVAERDEEGGRDVGEE